MLNKRVYEEPVAENRLVSAISNELIQKALDPDYFSGLLNTYWRPLFDKRLVLLGCRVHRLFPKGKDGLVIKYEMTLQVSGGAPYQQVLFGEYYPQDCRERRASIVISLQKRRRKQVSKTEDPENLFVIPEINLVCRLPGLDESLPGLSILTDRLMAEDIVLRIFPEFSGAGNIDISKTILNHRLAKRCIIKVTARSGGIERSLVLRCLRDREEKHRENHQTLTRLWEEGLDHNNPGRIRVPKSYGVDERIHAVIMECVPGTVLGESDQRSCLTEAGVAGLAIAHLHGIGWSPRRLYNRADELNMLQDWVTLTCTLRGDLRSHLTQAYGSIERRFTNLDASEYVLSHRDYYGKQLIFDGTNGVLIDFDTLSQAEPELDLGNFIAHRHLAAATGEVFDREEVSRFTESYRRAGGHLGPEQLQVWTDSALLRLACLYAQRTGWEAVPAKLLEGIRP